MKNITKSFSEVSDGKVLPKDLFSDSDFEIFHFRDIEHSKMGNYPHWHRYYELMMGIEGDVKIVSNGTIYNFSNSSIAIIPPGMVHSTIVSSELPVYERICFHWTSAYTKLLSSLISYDLAKEFDQLYVIKCNIRQFTALRILLDHLLQEDAIADKFNPMIRQISVMELLLQCARLIESKEGVNVKTETSLLVESTVNYIQQHFTETDLSLNEIAKMKYLSSRYLSKVFRSYTGNTVYQYIIQCRLLNACELMANGSMVTDACMQSGFNDYTCFLKSFKKAFKMTPRQYLQALQKGGNFVFQ